MFLRQENQKYSFCRENQELESQDREEYQLKIDLYIEKDHVKDVDKKDVNASYLTLVR